MKKRKILPVAIALVAVIAVSGVAYAFWTSGGSGTGEAKAGTTTDVTVHQTTSIIGLYPGGAPVTLSGNFVNLNSGPVTVGTVHAALGTVVKAVGAPSGTCDGTDFTLPTSSVLLNAVVPVSANPTDYQGSWTGITVQMVNKLADNQDGCKGATVNLTYSITNP